MKKQKINLCKLPLDERVRLIDDALSPMIENLNKYWVNREDIPPWIGYEINSGEDFRQLKRNLEKKFDCVDVQISENYLDDRKWEEFFNCDKIQPNDPFFYEIWVTFENPTKKGQISARGKWNKLVENVEDFKQIIREDPEEYGCL